MRSTTSPARLTHYQFDPVQTTKTSVTGAIKMPGLTRPQGAKTLRSPTR
jgi:UDP-glucuronate decarboxylase